MAGMVVGCGGGQQGKEGGEHQIKELKKQFNL